MGEVVCEAIEETVVWAESFALGRAVSPAQRELLRTAFAGLRQQLEVGQAAGELGGDHGAPFVCVPLLVYAGIKGQHAPAIPLAAATTLLFLGVDLLDDVADSDRPPAWAGRSEWEMTLVGSTLLASLWPLALRESSASPEVLADLERIAMEGLLRMAAGQQDDLTSSGLDDISASRVEASVALKSGEEVSMFSRMAARFAGVTPEQTEAYAEFGKSLGTAGQLSSDCYELFNDPRARDLTHGSRTLPVALHLERLNPAERLRFCSLLERARQHEPAREAVRQELAAAGALRSCAFAIETHCQRALRFLSIAKPHEPAGARLRRLVDAVSLFRSRVAGAEWTLAVSS